MDCPCCGTPNAYVGFSSIECRNPDCEHFKPEPPKVDPPTLTEQDMARALLKKANMARALLKKASAGKASADDLAEIQRILTSPFSDSDADEITSEFED